MGSLDVGMRADFVVLDADPSEVDPHEVRNIGIKATYKGGVRIF
jgi:predicted amidohydrolase YtcJ